MTKRDHYVISHTVEHIKKEIGTDIAHIENCFKCNAQIGISPATHESTKDLKDKKYICYGCFIKSELNGKFAEPTIAQMNEIRNYSGRTVRQQEVYEFYKEVRKELKSKR